MTPILFPTAARAAVAPGRRTVIAALLASLCVPAFATSDVVISQVYGGGGNSGSIYKNDFVELFNRSSKPVSLSGWSVQYNGATTPGNWQVTNLPAVTLQPGQYLLVQEMAGAGGTTFLPTPDATGTIPMGAAAGKVALVNLTTALNGVTPTATSIVDVFGFGSTATAFEGTVGPGLSNTTAALRADGGCIDTDNNAADFSTGAASPRNTASALHVCGAPVVVPIVASCPADLSLAAGSTGGASLSASDADGIVNSARITSAAVAGISLVDFIAASAAGADATVNLSISPAVPVGNYPVAISFGNDQAQTASCTIKVNVQALAAVTASIPTIQGSDAKSPLANSVQTTEGVVTLKVGSGFFIQDENGDGNPDTSDGIFVYTGSTLTGAKVGDKVRVTGTVYEYTPTGTTQSYTEFKDVTAVVTQSTGHSIAPTNVQLPEANLGRLQGMLVRFAQPLTVGQLEFLGSRGEVSLSSGRLEVPTNRYRPRTAEAIALAAANAQNQIVLDDGIFVAPSSVPYLGAEGSLRAGDSVSDLTGVIDFGATGGGGVSYKLQPSVAPVFSSDNPRTEVPQLAAGNVKVSSANVLNFFTTFTNGTDVFGGTNVGCTLGNASSKSNCRGADNLAEFVRQRDKIVHELQAIDADVFGLMEIQNSGETTVSYLVDELNKAINTTNNTPNAVTYAYVPKPADTGTDAIRVAMIYKPSRLSLVGVALSDSHAINNRPPMAQTFRAGNGEKFSLVVNHLKSKGSCPTGGGVDADQNDSQGCWNATRIKQAQQLIGSFVPQVAAAADDPDVLLIGDFNAHGFEDPINTITDNGYVNQLERFVRPNGTPYSFVFDGEAGYLDHALANARLSPQVVGAAEWHNNADEPTVIDYNLNAKPASAPYSAAPYRASDHDPVVISLNLQASYTDISASLRSVTSGLVFNRNTGLWTGSYTVTNTSGTTLTGPFQLQLDNLPSGVTLLNASGKHGAAPYRTFGAASLAPGASVTIPLSFSKTGTVAISYAARLYRGIF
ncbi:MAG: ExeM/NucH family extracellular endonuclease [Sphingomonadaceae bacterium]